MELKEIYPTISGIRLANVDNPLKHLIVLTVNDMNADIILNGLGKKVKLSYDYSESDNFFTLWVLNIDYSQKFKVHISINETTEQIMGWIATNQISDLWIGYPDETGKVVPYGLSTPVVA